ncbi:MAG TPA: endonuclease Q family protein [Methanocorpusculum sp.]|nr:endonuclease Q family protein [Methanocorpusculum sp.]HJJ40249.1 endonuclease Q family protein [Methanocorpusculum sp.]HJJ49638.1 endonuclease Q family protein [Methanocorpusculum sp.]HJJ57782.1 endonuclease Q family protein [Methanocorpusculum sp.]
MDVNTDLHIHSKFAIATSPDLSPETIVAGCNVKGIDAVATGDALHPEWRRMWQDFGDSGDVIIVPQTEVEDERRVHHVILAESLDQFAELQELLTPFCSHLATIGRPHIYANGEKIAEIVHQVGGYIGPAHAFTPWTSLFAAYDLPSECYGEEPFDFCELGLSADSSYGAGIEEFKDIPFLTNSDAHSQYPTKLGREFNRISLPKASTKNVLEAVTKGNITLNAGFFPEEGKYNRTACVRCYTQFTYEEAAKLHWKCPHDNGAIKLGVRERALHKATIPPTKRPPYLKIIPLGEVIARVLNVSSPNTKKAKTLYGRFIEAFDNEIDVLLFRTREELSAISPSVADAVLAMREGRIILHPGGGGQYGWFEFPKSC